MEELFTDFYDVEILDKIPHLRNYSYMLPFIGKYWQSSPYKTLLLGESHYIDSDGLRELVPVVDYFNDWYNNNSVNFGEYLSGYINTRAVVNKADKVNEFGYESPLTIFYNLKDILKNKISLLNNEEFIFSFFSYYNYFQRPAFIEGASIINVKLDDEIAYNTLKEMVSIIKPKQIVFVSTKAFDAFSRQKFQDKTTDLFKTISLDSVPHAGSAWWNKKSSKHGNKTGKEKFIEIVNTIPQ